MRYHPNIVLAPTSAGKTWAALQHSVFVDGDMVIDQLLGWPYHEDGKPDWWKGEDALIIHTRNAYALMEWARDHRDRIVLFNGDPSPFDPRRIRGVVVPPPYVLRRNALEKRARGVRLQPTDIDTITTNAIDLTTWAALHSIRMYQYFEEVL